MKVLWFTNTPSLYKNSIHSYNGGGWIESLELIVSSYEEINLAIAFKHPTDYIKTIDNNVTYYPIREPKNLTTKISDILFRSKNERTEITKYEKIIKDFAPDVIHIFGSESSFGLMSKNTKIPIVLHIQGIINPYLNAWFPPSFSYLSLLYIYRLNLLRAVRIFRELQTFKSNANREKLILRNIHYFMGRTEWDKQIISLMSPNSKYFYCSEVLRPYFYNQKPWVFQDQERITITSVISSPLYKGFDLILKTARILTEFTKLKFEWQVFGSSTFTHIERQLGISSTNYNIFLKGIANASQLVKELLNSSIYVHPSYIDNSPNSVCEAQILGLPVIATNVGGVSSLIKHEFNGILVPPNDPYFLASEIIKISTNKEFAAFISKNARMIAEERHNTKSILSSLISIYNEIKNDEY